MFLAFLTLPAANCVLTTDLKPKCDRVDGGEGWVWAPASTRAGSGHSTTEELLRDGGSLGGRRLSGPGELGTQHQGKK